MKKLQYSGNICHFQNFHSYSDDILMLFSVMIFFFADSFELITFIEYESHTFILYALTYYSQLQNCFCCAKRGTCRNETEKRKNAIAESWNDYDKYIDENGNISVFDISWAKSISCNFICLCPFANKFSYSRCVYIFLMSTSINRMVWHYNYSLILFVV